MYTYVYIYMCVCACAHVFYIYIDCSNYIYITYYIDYITFYYSILFYKHH